MLLDHQTKKEINQYKYENKLLYKNGKMVLTPITATTIIQSYHNSIYMHHWGIEKLYSMLNERIYIKNLKNYIKEVVNECNACKIAKAQPRMNGTLIPIVGKHFNDIVQVDIKGPLKESNGYKYIITFIDIYTGYTTLIPMRRKRNIDIIKNIIKYISRFGTPNIIQADNEFDNQLMNYICNNLGLEL